MFKSSSSSLPVVVEPSAVAGDDDVVSLFSHIVLASIYQSVDFSFALLLIILQKETKSQTGQPIEDGFCVKSFGRHQSEANKELFFKTFTRI